MDEYAKQEEEIHRILKQIRERYVRETKPYLDMLAKIQMSRPMKTWIFPDSTPSNFDNTWMMDFCKENRIPPANEVVKRNMSEWEKYKLEEEYEREDK